MTNSLRLKKEQIEKTLLKLNNQIEELNTLNKKEISKNQSGVSYSNESVIRKMQSNLNKLVQINLLK